MTGYEKRDHCGFFIITVFLVWIDSSMCAEYNGASFMKNTDHKPSYDYFYVLGVIHFFSENQYKVVCV